MKSNNGRNASTGRPRKAGPAKRAKVPMGQMAQKKYDPNAKLASTKPMKNPYLMVRSRSAFRMYASGSSFFFGLMAPMPSSQVPKGHIQLQKDLPMMRVSPSRTITEMATRMMAFVAALLNPWPAPMKKNCRP